MKKYLADFFRTMWKPLVIAFVAVAGTMYSIEKHYYIAMSAFGLVVSVVMCLWVPWLEESFKMRHCGSKKEAIVYSFFEALLYSYQIAWFGMGLFIIFRMPMMLLHAASGECYYHHPTKRMKVFWYINHSSWNIVASVIPTWLYTGTQVSNIRPTGLTIFLMLMWGTSLAFKLARKKEVVSC